MTFEEVYQFSEAEHIRNRAEYLAKIQNRMDIDYCMIDTMIKQAISDTFNFNTVQIDYIMSVAYDQYHSSYSDMPYGAKGICELIQNFPNGLGQ